MQAVVVSKRRLLSILKKNRAAHRSTFLDALAGYKRQFVIELERILEKARNGSAFTSVVSLEMPQDHTSDYNRVIGMLELTKERTIRLDEREYAMYVEDRWGWQADFLTTASAYSSKAKDLLQQKHIG